MAEATGRTVEEAVERALRQLGARREDSIVEVLQSPRPALLGFGRRDAVVRVTVKEPAPALRPSGPTQETETPLRSVEPPEALSQPALESAAVEVVGEIARRMGLDVSVTARAQAERVEVVLDGRDVPAAIGRHGQTLDAIEFLTAHLLGTRLGRRVFVVLDAGGYRGMRERTLRGIARRAAERAARERKPVFLDPMNARERRVVHLALRDDPRVTTSSVGEDDDRRVVVHPSERRFGARPEGAPEEVDEDDAELG